MFAGERGFGKIDMIVIADDAGIWGGDPAIRSGREMEAMDTLKPEIARLFAAKEAHRHRLAALPFLEKLRAVVRLQEMAAPLLRARGKRVRVWNLDDHAA